VYQRHEFMSERKEALRRWAQHVALIPPAARRTDKLELECAA
jgi:hypothetical protein